MRRLLVYGLLLFAMIWQCHCLTSLETMVKNRVLAARGHQTQIGGTVFARSHKGEPQKFRVLDLLSLEEGSPKVAQKEKIDGPLPGYFMTDLGRNRRATSLTRDIGGRNFIERTLHVGDVLGYGGFSTVFKVADENGKEFALKVSKICSSPAEVEERKGVWFNMDEERLQSLRYDSRFILQSYGLAEVKKGTQECYCIILELAQSGWLEGVTPSNLGGKAVGNDFTHADFATILYGIMMAMKSLADNDIFNADAKMQNMLLLLNPKTGTYIAKMADLATTMLTPIEDKRTYQHKKDSACYVLSSDGNTQSSCWTSSECIDKCVCTGSGTNYIRSGSFYESVVELGISVHYQANRVPQSCASPDRENRWSLATIITTTLTGVIRPKKHLHKKGLSDLYPEHFGKLNPLLRFGNKMSLPLYAGDRPDPDGPNPLFLKAKGIGKEYKSFAEAILSGEIDGRKVEVVDPVSMERLNDADRAAMDDLLELLRLCLDDSASLEQVISSAYIQTHARKDDYGL